MVKNVKQTRVFSGLFYYETKVSVKVGSDSYQRAIHRND